MNFFKSFRRISLAAVISAFFIAGLVTSQATEKNPAPKPNEEPASSQYVGADTCKTCHEEIFNGLQKTRHWSNLLKTKGGAEAHSCETCHGPGAEHVNSGGDKAKIFNFKEAAPDVVTGRCLSCHAAKQEHFGFKQSEHAANGVSCISCHSPHFAKESRRLLVEKQPALCYGCHTETKATFSMPFHHRVNEGLVRCTDCHNVHGSNQAHSLRATADQEAACFRCHRSLQGPFVFEHVPVKTEGCTACHQPHGSVNPRLLKVNQVNLLCLQCHTPGTTPNTRSGDTNAPATPASPVHDQSQKFQACTMCHVFIHGSNADATFMK
jgi:DmsE family decaheme c-type cytochrome